MTAYRIWRSGETVRIETPDGRSIDLAEADAAALGRELVPAAPPAPQRRVRRDHEELRRLYVDEGLPPREIAKLWGIKAGSVQTHLFRAGIPRRTRNHGNPAALAARNERQKAAKAAE